VRAGDQLDFMGGLSEIVHGIEEAGKAGYISHWEKRWLLRYFSDRRAGIFRAVLERFESWCRIKRGEQYRDFPEWPEE